MKTPFEEPKPRFIIKPTEESFQYWLNHLSLTQETCERLSKTNVLLVPSKDHTDEDIWYFPHNTTVFFDYLNRHKTEDLLIDACIEDDDYKELSLHSDILIIAGILVTQFVAPIIVNLISDYIYDRLGNRKDSTLVKAKLIVTIDKDSQAIEYDYYGPANEYHDIMRDALLKTNFDSGLSNLLPPNHLTEKIVSQKTLAKSSNRNKKRKRKSHKR